MEKINLFINGMSGKMGQAICSLLDQTNHHSFSVFSGASRSNPLQHKMTDLLECPIVFDFSSAEANEDLLDYFNSSQHTPTHLLIGSTGLSKSTVREWKKLSEKTNLACLYAPNTSLGVHLALKSALTIASIATGANFDIEIEETHHRYKKDSPSGTADYLAGKISEKANLSVVPSHDRSHKCLRSQGEIGVHSVRGGGVFGEHKIRFLGDFEEITISHRAFTRDLFAQGALVLGKWLLSQSSGFYEPMDIDFKDMKLT